MRFALLAGSASLFVAVAILACSSKTETTEEVDAGNPSPKPPETPPEETSSGTSGASGTSGTSGSSGSSGSYGTPEGGSGSSGTSGTSGTPAKDADVGDGNAGSLCQVGDVKESEDNGSAATANAVNLPSSFCGRLGAGDQDHAKFTLNSNCFGASWSYSSSPITITATVDGTTFNLNGGTYVCTMGKVYDITVTAAAPTDYRVVLEQKN